VVRVHNPGYINLSLGDPEAEKILRSLIVCTMQSRNKAKVDYELYDLQPLTIAGGSIKYKINQFREALREYGLADEPSGSSLLSMSERDGCETPEGYAWLALRIITPRPYNTVNRKPKETPSLTVHHELLAEQFNLAEEIKPATNNDLLNLIYVEVSRIADILDMHFGEHGFNGQLTAHPDDMKERKN
jgi:hypothetical protein